MKIWGKIWGEKVGEYFGDNSVCDLIFCGTCEENVHCDCPCSDAGDERCIDGVCRDYQGNQVCQICCDCECTCPCDDGSCPPCGPCPPNQYQCQDECCPVGYCCVDCVGGECDSDFGSGG